MHSAVRKLSGTGEGLADTLDGAADTDGRTKAGFALETALVGPVGVSSGNSTGWISMRIMACYALGKRKSFGYHDCRSARNRKVLACFFTHTKEYGLPGRLLSAHLSMVPHFELSPTCNPSNFVAPQEAFCIYESATCI